MYSDEDIIVKAGDPYFLPKCLVTGTEGIGLYCDISGTIMGTEVAGTYPITFSATDRNSNTVSQSINLIIKDNLWDNIFGSTLNTFTNVYDNPSLIYNSATTFMSLYSYYELASYNNKVYEDLDNHLENFINIGMATEEYELNPIKMYSTTTIDDYIEICKSAYDELDVYDNFQDFDVYEVPYDELSFEVKKTLINDISLYDKKSWGKAATYHGVKAVKKAIEWAYGIDLD